MTPSILRVELRDEVYAIIREPAAVFFSIAMPVGFFALFAQLYGAQDAGPVSVGTLMLATFGAFGVISVALMTPGVGVAEDRERGWLRVKRVSPVPIPTTLAAKVAAGLPVAFGVYTAMTLTAIAMGTFDAGLRDWLVIAGLLLLGSLPFSLLGLAVGFSVSGRAAPAVLNAVLIPMTIAGGLWMPLDALPDVVGRIAPWLPTYHVAQLGVAVLYDAPVTDNVAALLAFTAVTAVTAGLAYRYGRS